MTKKSRSERLIDTSESGREKPWAIHKAYSSKLSDAFFRIGKGSIADRMSVCGNYLKFKGCPDGHEKWLDHSNFCKARFCPMCQWRKSLKVFGEVFEVASLTDQYVQATGGSKIKWLFLTLTVQNVDGDNLPNTINQMLKGFNNLVRREPFKSYAYGWFRSLEVTRSSQLYVWDKRKREYVENEWVGTYHPHYHVLIAMKSSYFRSNDYKSTESWSKIWKKCCKIENYDPVVDIRTVKDSKAKDTVKDHQSVIEVNEDTIAIPAVAEVAKYTVKTKDLFYNENPLSDEHSHIELSNWEVDEVLFDLFASLNRRRLHEFGGLLKDMKQERDVAYTESLLEKKHKEQCGCSVCSSEFVEMLYSWIPDQKNYYRIVKQDQREKIEEKIDRLSNGKVKTIKRTPNDMGLIKEYMLFGHVDNERE